MKRERREESKQRQKRENQGAELLLGPVPSTAAPCPQFPRSFWTFTVTAVAQTSPLHTTGSIPIIQKEACQDILLGFCQGPG